MNHQVVASHQPKVGVLLPSMWPPQSSVVRTDSMLQDTIVSLQPHPIEPLEALSNLSPPPLPPRPSLVVDSPPTTQQPSTVMRSLTVRQNYCTFWFFNWSTSDVLTLMNIFFTTAQVACGFVILFLSFNESCDQPLRTFIAVYVAKTLLSYPLVYYQRHLQVEPTPDSLHSLPLNSTNERTKPAFKSGFNALMTLYKAFETAWFIVGNYWLLSTQSCSPLLFFQSMVFIIIGYIVIFIPLILCGAVLLCLPCVLVFMRWIGLGEKHGWLGVSAEDMRRIPIVRYRKRRKEMPLDIPLHSLSSVSPPLSLQHSTRSSLSSVQLSASSEVGPFLQPRSITLKSIPSNGNRSVSGSLGSLLSPPHIASPNEYVPKLAHLFNSRCHHPDGNSSKNTPRRSVSVSTLSSTSLPKPIQSGSSFSSSLTGTPWPRTSCPLSPSETPTSPRRQAESVSLRKSSTPTPPPKPPKLRAPPISGEDSFFKPRSKSRLFHSVDVIREVETIPADEPTDVPCLESALRFPLLQAQSTDTLSPLSTRSRTASVNDLSSFEEPVISRSNTVLTHRSDEIELDDVDSLCVICLTKYVEGEKLRILKCQHHFHVKCVDEWLKTNKTCPLCVQTV